LPSPEEQARFSAAYKLLKTIAVTGTNGKTTTVSMIAAIVAASGEPEARLTTLGSFVAGKKIDAGPLATEFLTTVEAAIAAEVKTFALEVTSKALRTGWAQQWPAHIAVFTNLSRDHLDMHHTGEAYFAAKAQLFLSVAAGGQCILNAGDDNATLLAEAISPDTPVHWYSTSAADRPLALAAARVESTRKGLQIVLADSPLAAALGGSLALPIVGAVHADNALAAALAGHQAGYAPSAIRLGLENFAGVPGRFQIVAAAPLTVVDYAHTPDGLRGTLETARSLVEDGGVLRLVFGCGGERDQGKRPEMGRLAHALADYVTVTNDNPRREDPQQIAESIEAGAEGQGAVWNTVLDRREAVAKVVGEAGPRDVVILAGKGHEDTQEIEGKTIPLCDVQLARTALEQRT
jgi:UDP-N-acetylmuramoyl-L-alanyl-D-glutamate--2,6-diaminopimelate ligase